MKNHQKVEPFLYISTDFVKQQSVIFSYNFIALTSFWMCCFFKGLCLANRRDYLRLILFTPPKLSLKRSSSDFFLIRYHTIMFVVGIYAAAKLGFFVVVVLVFFWGFFFLKAMVYSCCCHGCVILGVRFQVWAGMSCSLAVIFQATRIFNLPTHPPNPHPICLSFSLSLCKFFLC